MSPAIQLLMALVAALLSLTISPAGAQDLLHPAALVHDDTYEAVRAPATPTFGHDERGPPADGSPEARAVDHWSRGASARPYHATTYHYTDYDRSSQPVAVGGIAAHQTGVGAATTTGDVRATDWASSSLTAGQVAAKTSDEFVDLASTSRRTHILDGDATGGGHLWPALPGKTPFPKDWSADRVMHEISDVATDPNSIFRSGRGGSTIATGTRNGVDIKVVLRGGQIITGHPTNLPRNPW